MLASYLDELGVLEDASNLLGGGVAADVLFLEHFPEGRPVFDIVDDVLEDLLLSPGSVGGCRRACPTRIVFAPLLVSSLL